jgi:hypothetical protein
MNTDNAAGHLADISIKVPHFLIRDNGQHGRSTVEAYAVVTQSGTTGPNSVPLHVTWAIVQPLYPHQRRAHGFHADVSGASVSFITRGSSGSGHG